MTEPIAVSERNDATGEVALAALLGALGLAAVGGIALAVSRRRRRGQVGPATVALERSAQAETVPARTAEPLAPPVFTELAPFETAFATPVVGATSASAMTGRAKGDPIPLPTAVPQTFEERDALLKELVSAQPDKANPFTSPRARARRAKLIMQSLGRSFQSRKPRIDLSEYTNRWPALRGWQPATA